MLRSFLNPISKFWYALLNLVYPQNCLICNYKLKTVTQSLICEACLNKIDANITSCGVESDEKDLAFDSAFYAATYDDTIKRCVHLFKYEDKAQIGNLLGELMLDFAGKNINVDEIDLVVPVPLHPLKLRERQFNQSEALAIHLAKGLNIKIAKNKVKRIKYTLPQTELKREERLRNVSGAFSTVSDNDFRDKTILLVDDVFTTGATLHECAKALKDAGAKKVVAFALAKGN